MSSARPILRWLVAHERLCAVGLLLAVILVELWPALLTGQLLAPISSLYLFPPWTDYAPFDVADYFNRTLIDVPLAYYPWTHLARDLIHDGVFPAWNPYAFAGTPFFANPQLAWFSPFSLPLWTLPLNYAFGVAAALKLGVAGLGTYLLVRELQLGFWAAIVAAVSYMLCAFNVVWMTHGGLVAVAALLPWMIWLTERIVRRPTAFNGIALAGASAVMFSAGHPGTQVHVVTAIGVYAIVRTLTTRDVAPRDRVRRLATVGLGVALGALLLAVTLIPTLAQDGTAGELARRDKGSTLPAENMPFGIVKTILFPDWWGRSSDIEVAGPSNFNERTMYAGGVALLLACAALVAPGAWRRKAPFAVLALLGLAAALDVPPLPSLLDNIPPFDTVQNQRMMFLFMFATAVLAAFGTEAILKARGPNRRTWGVLAAGLLVAVVAVVAIAPTGEEVGDAFSHFTTGAGYKSPHVLALTSVGWWLLLTFGVALILLVREQWARVAPYAAVLLAALATADMLHFAHGYQPIGPSSDVIPPATPAVEYLEAHRADGRVTGLGAAFPADWTTVYRLRDIRGYDPPQPSLRYLRLWKLLNPRQQPWQPFVVSTVNPPGRRLLNVLGARYLVAGPGITLGKDASPDLSLGYSAEDATIIENRGALPRAMVAPSARIADGEKGVFDALNDDGFDPHDEVLVDRGDADAIPRAGKPVRGATATIVDEANAKVRMRASLPRSAIVMLNDQWSDGWKVKVDGRDARALQVNGVMRGVVVGAGTHSVVWEYQVPGLRLGLLLSGLGLLGIVAWVAIAVAGRRRRGDSTG